MEGVKLLTVTARSRADRRQSSKGHMSGSKRTAVLKAFKSGLLI